MKYLILIFSISLFAISCDKKQHSKTEIINLRHQPIWNDNEILLGTPRLFVLRDSVMIVGDFKTDSLFHYINRDNNIKSFGKRGQGPKEFLFPSSLYAYSQSDSFCLFDANKRLVSSLKFSDTIATFNPLYKTFPYNHYMVIPVNNSNYVSAGIYQDAYLYLLDNMGNPIYKYDCFPYRNDIEKNLDKTVLSQAYMGTATTNKDGNKLVFVTGFSKIISFFEIDKQKIILKKEVVEGYPDYEFNKETVKYKGISRTSPSGFLSVTSSERYVYALYSGKNYKEHGLDINYGNSIFVYDWNGNLIREIQMDISASQIRIDSKDHFIYALVRNPDPMIVRFEIK